jgi:hypothetical protein
VYWASAGADHLECGICAGPAYVVIPQAKKKGDAMSNFAQTLVWLWEGFVRRQGNWPE